MTANGICFAKWRFCKASVSGSGFSAFRSPKFNHKEMKKGIESFKAEVMKDCQSANNCFSENGCTKERYKYLPEDNPKLIEMGIKQKCVANTKCTHDYCGKYKWVLERAKHYAEKTGKTVEEVMEIWENDRTYWYMNYYQLVAALYKLIVLVFF